MAPQLTTQSQFLSINTRLIPVTAIADGFTIWGGTWYTGSPLLSIDTNPITAWTYNALGSITYDLGSTFLIDNINVSFSGSVSNGNYVELYVNDQLVSEGIQPSGLKAWDIADVSGRYITYKTIAKPHNEYLQIASWSEIAEFSVDIIDINSEYIDGTSQNDNITGGVGNDTLNGGQGLDTSVYVGNSSEYLISLGSITSQVVDSFIERDGTDSLTNIERLQFSDTNIALDIEGTAGQAYRIYEAVLGRAPDKEGLGYWINDMDNGVSLTTIAQGFIASKEFQDKYGANPPYETYVNLLYQNILGRAPDAEGLDYWLSNMRSGTNSPAVVLASFSEGYENKANVLPDIANGIFYAPWMT